MTFGAEIWGPPLIQAAGSVASGWLSGQGSKQKETKLQRTQRKLIDDLLMSLKGEGSYSDLFNSSEEVFNKSFVEPAKAMFRNQVAPQIQQSYIASGQQRGTGLDDQLLRAGVDLDQMLNRQYYNFTQDAMNRSQNIMSNILGQAGVPYQTSGAQDAMSGLGGYFGSEGFAKTTADLFNKYVTPKTPARKGFEPAAT